MKPKILIAVPSLFPYVPMTFVDSLMQLQKPEGTVTCTLRGSLTALARNQLVDIAKKNGFTHIFFMDSDMTFPPDTLIKLLAHDKDFVGGTYYERYAPYRPTLMKELPDEPEEYTVVDPRGKTDLIEVDGIGAGCTLIKLSVFEGMETPYYDYRLDKIGEREKFWAEDIHFCAKVRKKGVQIWADPTVKCAHLLSEFPITEECWDGTVNHR
jgi:hypothetical protein